MIYRNVRPKRRQIATELPGVIVQDTRLAAADDDDWDDYDEM
jgi:hypothetical protein